MISRVAAMEALLVTVGRIAFVGFWFVAVLLIYRGLGTTPRGLAEAGFFGLSIACIKTAAGFISDPIDLAVMRKVPPLLATNASRASDMLRAAFGLRAASALIVATLLGLGAPSAGLIAPEWGAAAPFLRFAALAIVGDTLVRALLVMMQAKQRFFAFLLLEGSVSLLRFVAVVALWLSGAMRTDLVLLCYAGASFVVAGAGAVATGVLGAAATRAIRRYDLLDLVHYLKWMVPAMMLAAVNERLDVFLVYSLAGASDAGLYAAALSLALIPDILGGCLSTLIQPRIVTMHAAGLYALRLRQFLSLSIPACAVVYGLSLVLSGPLFGLVLGPKYVAAAPAFHWLFAGTLFWLAVTPLPMTLVAVTAPRRIVLVTAAQSAIVVLGAVALVPSHGWVGMAQAVFLMRVLVALLLLVSARGIATDADLERPSALTPEPVSP